MITVGIETSGTAGSIALLRDDECVLERPLDQTGRRHARTLVLELKQMLKDAGLRPSQIDVTAVSRGPGSFTGLRVGFACAKMLAYAAETRIVAVDTFLAVAETSPRDLRRVAVVRDAQRGELYVGDFEQDSAGNWRERNPLRIDAKPEWPEEFRGCELICVVESAAVTEPLREATAVPVRDSVPMASRVALIGRRRAEQELWDDVATLEPLYVRRSAAEERADSGV